jgi:hypothetical protein
MHDGLAACLLCRATAVLAKAFKMKVVALRRNTTLSEEDKGIVVRRKAAAAAAAAAAVAAAAALAVSAGGRSALAFSSSTCNVTSAEQHSASACVSCSASCANELHAIL